MATQVSAPLAEAPVFRPPVAQHVRRRLVLPHGARIGVEAGGRVRASDFVAEATVPGPAVAIDLAHELDKPAAAAFRGLAVRVGESVRRGQALARRGGIAGWFGRPVTSPLDGVVESISAATASLIVRAPARTRRYLAGVDGAVVHVDAAGVIIEGCAWRMAGRLVIGETACGALRCAVMESEGELTADGLRPDDAGRVLLAGTRVDAEVMRRAAQVGVAGLVVGGVDEQVAGLIEPPHGGHPGPTLLVLDGFGRREIDARVLTALMRLDGRVAVIDESEACLLIAAEESDVRHDGDARAVAAVSEGDRLRVRRGPAAGEWGRCVAIRRDAPCGTTGVVAPVAVELEFGDSRRLALPVQNVEIVDPTVERQGG